jgi:ankyrin repeat protein
MRKQPSLVKTAAHARALCSALSRRRRRHAGKLFAACDEGDVDAVRALAPGAAAHLNTWGPDSDTLLHTAAVYGHESIVEELLRLGADPSVTDDNAGTPLVRCARCRVLHRTQEQA